MGTAEPILNAYSISPQKGPFKDCQQAKEAGHSNSGIYMIKPENSNEPMQLWCENSLDPGGWAVIQKRTDGSVNFFRNWDSYKVNFGMQKISCFVCVAATVSVAVKMVQTLPMQFFIANSCTER